MEGINSIIQIKIFEFTAPLIGDGRVRFQNFNLKHTPRSPIMRKYKLTLWFRHCHQLKSIYVKHIHICQLLEKETGGYQLCIHNW